MAKEKSSPLFPIYTPAVSFSLMMGEENDLLQISPTAWNLIRKQWSHRSYLTQVVGMQGATADLSHSGGRSSSIDLVSYYYGNLETFVAAKG